MTFKNGDLVGIIAPDEYRDGMTGIIDEPVEKDWDGDFDYWVHVPVPFHDGETERLPFFEHELKKVSDGHEA